jgi:4,5-dihydroxyphthalate decarboxylase
MLPWLTAHVEEARRKMGDDFWPYGLERDRHTLATFLRYSHEQGLSQQPLEPEQLFATSLSHSAGASVFRSTICRRFDM